MMYNRLTSAPDATYCVLFVMAIAALAWTVKPASAQPIDVYDRSSWDEPVMIAHRGGVVNDTVSENTIPAIDLAKRLGFAMVEVDIRESKDHVPVAFHDTNMLDETGLDATIESLPLDSIRRVAYVRTGLPIITLDEFLDRAAELELGIMLDIKSTASQKDPPRHGSETTEASVEFFRRIAELVAKHGLERSTVSISEDPLAYEHLARTAMMRLTEEEIRQVERGEAVSLDGKFWFGWPRHITNDMVKALQEAGALVVPSINVQHYPLDSHMERAEADIERMKLAGVDAYQIDGEYARFVE